MQKVIHNRTYVHTLVHMHLITCAFALDIYY